IKSDIQHQQLSLENLKLGQALQQTSQDLYASHEKFNYLHEWSVKKIAGLQKQIDDLQQQSAEKMLELEKAYKFMGAKADAWKKSYQELLAAYEQMRKRQESLPAPQKAA